MQAIHTTGRADGSPVAIGAQPAPVFTSYWGDVFEVRFRAVCGWDDDVLGSLPVDEPARAARLLLERLGTGPAGERLSLVDLPIGLVDRLLAELYIRIYGDDAACQGRCSSCGEKFEFSLNLRYVMAEQDRQQTGPPDGEGTWQLDDNRRVRAPLLGDVIAADSVAALGEALTIEGSYDDDPMSVAAFLELAAPVLTIDLLAPCAGCGETQPMRFDIDRYLGSRLFDDCRFLIREVHLIAQSYGWSRPEILDMTQQDRRAHVNLIVAERSAVRQVRR